MRSRGWGASGCRPPTNWDQELGPEENREGDRQTEKWTQGVCQRDKNREEVRPSEQKPETQRKRGTGEGTGGGTDGEMQRHKEMKQPWEEGQRLTEKRKERENGSNRGRKEKGRKREKRGERDQESSYEMEIKGTTLKDRRRWKDSQPAWAERSRDKSRQAETRKTERWETG